MGSKFIIYGLIDPRTDVVRYVGKSKSGLRRPKAHNDARSLTANTHKARWIRQLHRDGLDYGIRVLEEFTSAEVLNDAECFWIAQGRGLGWDLTNHTSGGDGRDGPISEGHKQKISRALRGRNFSAEHRRRLGEGSRGRVFSETHRANIAAAKRGKATRTGAKLSDETKAKIGASSRGRRHTAETRAKISASLLEFNRGG